MGSTRGMVSIRGTLNVLAAVLLLGGAGLAAVALKPGRSSSPVPTPRGAHLTPAGLYAISIAGPQRVFFRVDPRSLRRVGRGQLVLREPSGGVWSFSPDRSQLTLAQGGSLAFIDLRRLRVRSSVRVTKSGRIVLSSWLTPRRVLAFSRSCCPRSLSLSVVDPVARRVLVQRLLKGNPEKAARSELGLVVLFWPEAGAGPPTLARVDANGSVRSVVLNRIRAGVEADTATGGKLRRASDPGLAVDPDGRAYVVAGDAPVAEVDLATMTVNYHDLGEPVSLLGRLRSWLEPEVQADARLNGPLRSARWLGRGMVAVSGTNGRFSVHSDGTIEGRYVPAGLQLIDTKTWSVQTLDSESPAFAYPAGRLIAFHSAASSAAEEAVVAFTLDGHELFRLRGLGWLGLFNAYQRYVYVPQDDQSVAVVDASRAKVIARAAGRFDLFLISPDDQLW